MIKEVISSFYNRSLFSNNNCFFPVYHPIKYNDGTEVSIFTVVYSTLRHHQGLKMLCLMILFTYYSCNTFPQKEVNSVWSLRIKVVPWCKTLTNGVSRQRRRMRRRKQSPACFCFTSSAMTWPLHRSPLHTMGFLLNTRTECVRVCVSVCVSSFLTTFLFCSHPKCSLESQILMLLFCVSCTNILISCLYLYHWNRIATKDTSIF